MNNLGAITIAALEEAAARLREREITTEEDVQHVAAQLDAYRHAIEGRRQFIADVAGLLLELNPSEPRERAEIAVASYVEHGSDVELCERFGLRRNDLRRVHSAYPWVRGINLCMVLIGMGLRPRGRSPRLLGLGA